MGISQKKTDKNNGLYKDGKDKGKDIQMFLLLGLDKTSKMKNFKCIYL